MKSFEKMGTWFLPKTPDKKVSGQLIFSSDQRPKLNLFGELSSLSIQQKLESTTEYSIIHGYLIDNNGESDKVTLCNCTQKNGFKTGIQTSLIYIEYILKGYHFSSLDEISFTGINVKYTHLEEWVNLPNASIECTPHENKKEIFREINFKQKVNEPIEIAKLNDCSIIIIDQPWISLQNIQYSSFLGWNSREISLKEQKSILIKSQELKKLSDLLDIAHLIQQFLTFSCSQMILLSEITTYVIGKTPELQYLSNDFSDDDYKLVEVEKPFYIEMYYQISSPLMNQQSFDIDKILFKFTDIQGESNIVLEKWEDIQKNLEPIIQLYLGLYYLPTRYRNDLFLTLAQAIEGFHRFYYGGKYCDKNTFKKIRKELGKTFLDELKVKENEIDQSYRESLLSKINYWNEYSLRERLEDLLSSDDFNNCLPDNFFVPDEDKKNFINQVKDTRNSLTHPSSDLSDKSKKSKYITSGKELDKLIRKLKIILDICLLQSLGIDSSSIKLIISRRL